MSCWPGRLVAPVVVSAAAGVPGRVNSRGGRDGAGGGHGGKAEAEAGDDDSWVLHG